MAAASSECPAHWHHIFVSAPWHPNRFLWWRRKGSLLALLNPWGDAYKNAKRAKASNLVKDSNLNGDGLTLGGERPLGTGAQRASPLIAGALLLLQA